jgi:hypothetical protein
MPVMRYSTLTIGKIYGKPERRAAGETDEEERSRTALHFARGHFKDFRGGPGLFGKHKELYWWGPQLRGSAQHGVVGSQHVITAVDGSAVPKTTIHKTEVTS